jgi:hypothetical protein
MAQYSYINPAGGNNVLADTSVNFRGAWSGSTPYALLDAASYNSRWFIAITAHTGVTPPSTFVIETPTYWSPLVLIEGDPQILDTASEIAAANAVATSDRALAVAWTGTNTADRALAVAWAGTDAAAAAYSVARTALDTAWTGTQSAAAANALLARGVSGTVWGAMTNGAQTDTQVIFEGGLAIRIQTVGS